MPILEDLVETPAPAAAAGRAAHRSALDASIERELRRGEAAGSAIARVHWDLLDALVEYELKHPTPATEITLSGVAPIFGVLRGIRFQRRLAWLIQHGFARRERASLRPTVAGIAAVRPFSSLPGSHRPSQGLLRDLRRGEIGRI